MMYGIKSWKGIEKEHKNQLKKRFIENEPNRLKEPMECLYDTFQAPTNDWTQVYKWEEVGGKEYRVPINRCQK